MRPGIDQLPGTCKEYYIADTGVAYCGTGASYLINTLDTPLYIKEKCGTIPLRFVRMILRTTAVHFTAGL